MGTVLREFCYVPATKVGALSEAAACRFVSSACSIRYDTIRDAVVTCAQKTT